MISALKSNDTVLLGVLNRFADTGVLEALCIADWDFVWIDGQHGQFNYTSLIPIIQLLESWNIGSVLRVPSDDLCVLGPYADLTPDAIMIPMVESAQQAQRIVQALRFPPDGNRSFGGERALSIRAGGMDRAKRLLIIAQIETPEGADCAEEIISTEGIDGIFFGAEDLKMRMDIDMSLDVTSSAELGGLAKQIAKLARERGKFVGAIAANPKVLQFVVEAGYRLINCGIDTGMIQKTSRAIYEMMTKSKGLCRNGLR